MEVYQEKLWGNPEKIETEIQDPRPDLIEDSKLWKRLLNMAKDKNRLLAITLHGFRCCGLRIQKDSIGYVLRPEFNTNSQWQNQAEYEEYRNKWLMRYRQEIIGLLDKLE